MNDLCSIQRYNVLCRQAVFAADGKKHCLEKSGRLGFGRAAATNSAWVAGAAGPLSVRCERIRGREVIQSQGQKAEGCWPTLRGHAKLFGSRTSTGVPSPSDGGRSLSTATALSPCRMSTAFQADVPVSPDIRSSLTGAVSDAFRSSG